MSPSDSSPAAVVAALQERGTTDPYFLFAEEIELNGHPAVRMGVAHGSPMAEGDRTVRGIVVRIRHFAAPHGGLNGARFPTA